jgi:hypothetical protein
VKEQFGCVGVIMAELNIVDELNSEDCAGSRVRVVNLQIVNLYRLGFLVAPGRQSMFGRSAPYFTWSNVGIHERYKWLINFGGTGLYRDSVDDISMCMLVVIEGAVFVVERRLSGGHTDDYIHELYRDPWYRDRLDLERMTGMFVFNGGGWVSVPDPREFNYLAQDLWGDRHFFIETALGNA